ncbi:general substrate transporter [Cadophora sp. DSE1049]|nr:general substrate transporter [Cadophora sp. DSE1049]
MAAISFPDPTQEKPAISIVEHQETLENGTPAGPKNVILEAIERGQGVSGYENLTLWQTVNKFRMSSLVCFAAAISAGTDGYQIGMIGNIIANTGFVERFGTKVNGQGERYLTSPILSGWSAMGSIGQIIGMTTLPFLSDRYGRKIAMYVYWALLAISIMLECVARNWQVWLVAKLVGGIGVGCLQCTLPTYISEVAPVRIRGALLSCYTFWWIVGQFFAPVALQVMYETSPHNYLTPVYTQWGMIGLMIIIYVLIPESPAWCADRGKPEAAKKALLQLNRGVKDYDVEYQYNLLVINIEHERAVAAEQRKENWYAIFKGRDGFRTVVSLWTGMSNQFIGLGVFYGYGTYFFQQAGVKDPFKITCITSGINIATSVMAILFADRAGRRLLACAGTTVCWVCTIAVGILGVVPPAHANNILLVLFASFWNIGLVSQASAATALSGEVSSQRLRHHTNGFALASTCVVGVAMGVLLPYMINKNEWNWGLKTSFFFTGVGFPFTLAIWFLIPETSNRSAAELDELFERKIKPWRFSKTETVTERLVVATETEHISDN